MLKSIFTLLVIKLFSSCGNNPASTDPIPSHDSFIIESKNVIAKKDKP